MRIYHGTSEENAKNILKNGFSSNKHNWYPSMNDSVYFYFAGEAMDYDDLEAKLTAVYNGQIAAALGKSQSSDIYVLSIEVDESFSDDEFRDYSCEGMSNVALEIPISLINEKQIDAEVFENAFVPSLSLVYLCRLSENYLNKSHLTDVEQQILLNQSACDNLGKVYSYVCEY